MALYGDMLKFNQNYYVIDLKRNKIVGSFPIVHYYERHYVGARQYNSDSNWITFNYQLVKKGEIKKVESSIEYLRNDKPMYYNLLDGELIRSSINDYGSNGLQLISKKDTGKLVVYDNDKGLVTLYPVNVKNNKWFPYYGNGFFWQCQNGWYDCYYTRTIFVNTEHDVYCQFSSQCLEDLTQEQGHFNLYKKNNEYIVTKKFAYKFDSSSKLERLEVKDKKTEGVVLCLNWPQKYGYISQFDRAVTLYIALSNEGTVLDCSENTNDVTHAFENGMTKKKSTGH